MKQINIFLAALVILFATSCKGFLDVKPSNQASSESSIQSASDAQIMINGLLNKMTSGSYYGRNFLLYGDGKGGDVTTYSAGNGGDGYYYFTHSPSSNSFEGYWSTIYNCLLQANNIIKNINTLKEGGSTENFDNYLGQALTLRALFHFDLVRLYGKPYNMDKASYGVPVVTEPVDASAQLTRNSVEEVYTQIVKDLTEAAPLLSKKRSNGYINYYANQALLAKVYMYMDNFADALSAAEEVINDGVYSLYKPAEWVDSWKNQFGKESIFELAVVQGESDLGTGSVGCYFRRYGHGSANILGVFLTSQYWIDLMDDNDVRLGIMGDDVSVADDGRADRAGKGSCYKYSGSTNLDGDGKGNSTAVNIKIMRLSEVYLNAAEAAVRTNDQDKAKGYLKEIAQRNPNWVEPATVTLEDIQDERRREFLTEGIVYHEYMRMDMTIEYDDDAFGRGTTPPSNGRGKKINRTFDKCRLPIGQGELNANPNIAEQQNPGY